MFMSQMSALDLSTSATGTLVLSSQNFCLEHTYAQDLRVETHMILDLSSEDYRVEHTGLRRLKHAGLKIGL